METHLTRAVLIINLVFALVADDTNNSPLSHHLTLRQTAAGSNSTTFYSYHSYTTAVGAANHAGNSSSRAGSSPDGIAVSRNNPKSKEVYSYRITPANLDVKVGDSYALTCRTDSTEGFDQLSWMIETNSDSKQPLDCDRENEERFKCGIREYPNGLFSVLNVTSFEDGSSHSSVDYTFYCTGNLLLLSGRQEGSQQQKQRGVAVVTVHPDDHKLETGLEVAGGTLLVLVVLLAAFLVFRKGQLRSTFAGIRHI